MTQIVYKVIEFLRLNKTYKEVIYYQKTYKEDLQRVLLDSYIVLSLIQLTLKTRVLFSNSNRFLDQELTLYSSNLPIGPIRDLVLIKEIGYNNSSSTTKRVSLRTVLIVLFEGLGLRVIILSFQVYVRYIVEGKTRVLTLGSRGIKGSIRARVTINRRSTRARSSSRVSSYRSNRVGLRTLKATITRSVEGRGGSLRRHISQLVYQFTIRAIEYRIVQKT